MLPVIDPDRVRERSDVQPTEESSKSIANLVRAAKSMTEEVKDDSRKTPFLEAVTARTTFEEKEHE